MQEEAALLKVLGETTRLKLAVLLLSQGETCVCQLARALAEPEYKISRHLGVMRSAGLVEARREGAKMRYRLVKPRCSLEECLYGFFRDQLAKHRALAADIERLRELSGDK